MKNLVSDLQNEMDVGGKSIGCGFQGTENPPPYKTTHPIDEISGPTWIRTTDRPVMHPTTAFAAPFGFVGWTIPSPSKLRGLPSSLYTFLIKEAWLGISVSPNTCWA